MAVLVNFTGPTLPPLAGAAFVFTTASTRWLDFN